MSFTPAFSISTTPSNPAAITISDTSTGSDILITDRTIQLLTNANTLLVPIIDFPLSDGNTITISPLQQDAALHVVVSWDYALGVVQYQTSQIYAFTGFGEQFLYTQIQTLTTNPSIINNVSFFDNLEQLDVLIDSAKQAINTAQDLNGSQAAIQQYQSLITSISGSFIIFTAPQIPTPPPSPPPTIAGITQLIGDGSAGPGTGTQTLTLANTGVTAGAYTNANVTVNAKGLVTSAASGSTPVGGITQLQGDVAAGPGTGIQQATLAASGVTPGTYTFMTATVDAKGRLTAASSNSPSGFPTSFPTTASLGILTNGTDQTTVLNGIFSNSNYEGIIMDFKGGGAVTISGTLNCQGKTIIFYPGSYFTGTGGINNFILYTGERQKCFDTSLTIASIGFAQGYMSVWAYGAQDNGVDCSLAMQKTIDTVISNGPNGHIAKVRIPTGTYTLSNPLILSRWTGSTYSNFQLILEGDCLFSEASGYGTVLNFGFNNRFGIGVQGAKSTIIKGIKSNGQWGYSTAFPSGAYAFYNATYASITDGVTRDTAYSPSAGFVVDPFGPSIPSDGGYPGTDAYGNNLSTYYRGGTGGSTGVVFEDCFAAQWLIPFITSPNGQTANAELLRFERIQISNYKVGFVGCQPQEKMNVIKHVQAWGEGYYIFAASQLGYGGNQGTGNWYLEDLNLAGRNNSLCYISSGGYYPVHFNKVFAESLGQIGFVSTTLGILFQEMHIDFAYYNNGGAFQYIPQQMNCSGCTFQNCTLRINGTDLPVTINTTGGPSIFRNCAFETVPFFAPTNNGFGGNPIFDNCFVGSYILGRNAVSEFNGFESSLSCGTFQQNGFQINSDTPARPFPINTSNTTYTITPALSGSYYAVTLNAVGDEITSSRIQVGDVVCATPDQTWQNTQVLGIITAIGVSTFTITYISNWVTSGNAYYLYLWLPLWNIAFTGDVASSSNVLHNVTAIAGNLTTFSALAAPRGGLIYSTSFTLGDTQQSHMVRVISYNSGANTITADKNFTNTLTKTMISQLDCKPLPGTPTATPGTGAGSGGTAAINKGNDRNMQLKVVTGSGPNASSTIATINLSVGFAGGYIPSPTLEPANSAAASIGANNDIWIDATRPDTLTLSVGSSALNSGATYLWNIQNS